MNLIEQKLISIIAIENYFTVLELALIYELKQLLNALKNFAVQKKEKLVEEKLFLSNSLELIEKFVEFANLSQTQLILVLNLK